MIRNILCRHNNVISKRTEQYFYSTITFRGNTKSRGNALVVNGIKHEKSKVKESTVGLSIHNRILSTSSNSWNWSTSNNKEHKEKNEISSKTQEEVSSSSSSSFTSSIDLELQQQVLSESESLYSSLMPLNEKIRGPLAKVTDRGTSLPFVFLVGNHSSGKSSFVNYLLGRNIQTSGVAPTDDRFTVISPGPYDTDQDGPALIGDPDLGFAPLRQFGPTLIHHTQLKIRNNIRDDINFMLIDSPGMIDSPTNVNDDRGYDFPGVVKWFAERAGKFECMTKNEIQKTSDKRNQ